MGETPRVATAVVQVALASDWVQLSQQRGQMADDDFAQLLQEQPLAQAAALCSAPGPEPALTPEQLLLWSLEAVASADAAECAKASFVLGCAAATPVGVLL